MFIHISVCPQKTDEQPGKIVSPLYSVDYPDDVTYMCWSIARKNVYTDYVLLTMFAFETEQANSDVVMVSVRNGY